MKKLIKLSVCIYLILCGCTAESSSSQIEDPEMTGYYTIAEIDGYKYLMTTIYLPHEYSLSNAVYDFGSYEDYFNEDTFIDAPETEERLTAEKIEESCAVLQSSEGVSLTNEQMQNISESTEDITVEYSDQNEDHHVIVLQYLSAEHVH